MNKKQYKKIINRISTPAELWRLLEFIINDESITARQYDTLRRLILIKIHN